MKCCSFTKFRDGSDLTLVSIDDLATNEQAQSGSPHRFIARGDPVKAGEYIRQIFSWYPRSLIAEHDMRMIILGI